MLIFRDLNYYTMEKSKTILTMVIFLAGIGASAQKAIVIKDDSLKVGQNYVPSITALIPEISYEKTLKAWTRELQSGTKSKVVTEAGIMSIFGAKIKSLSPDPLNVYSSMATLDSMVKITASIETKKDFYISAKNGETELSKAKLWLKEFGKSEYISLAKDQLNAEEKKLNEIERELSSLEREKTSLQKSIESNNSKIIEEKDNITLQKNELENVTAEIALQNQQLSQMQEGTVKKEKEDYLKTLEKRKKRAMDAIENSNNRINKANNEISKANLEIPKNEQQQQQVNQRIDRQKGVCGTFEEKVAKIKAF